MILKVVSHCPVCAAPIYGPESAEVNMGPFRTFANAPSPLLPINVSFSCECRVEMLRKVRAEAAKAERETLSLTPPATVEYPPGR